MPSLAQHQSKSTIKLLFIGDSGGGKTGALASLAGAGYNLRILDLDNGLDILANMLSDPKSPYPKGSSERVLFKTLTERMKNVGGVLMPTTADVWGKAIAALTEWKEPAEGDAPAMSLGHLSTWGIDDVIVIDSLTMLSTAALNFILSLNGRLGKKPYESDWGEAQSLVEGLLQLLYAESTKCNVIVNCHIKYIGNEEAGTMRAYPNTLGKALPPKVGTYFNNALMVQTRGSGVSQKRVIVTNTSGLVELKNSAPLRVAREYPIETGLASYFEAVMGRTPTPVAKPTPTA